MRIRASLAAAALLFSPLALLAQEHGGNDHAKMEHPVTIVVIVRHAEKAAQPAADPPLTATGQARAQSLADLLANANVGAVLHTPTTRTRETARPTAERYRITSEILPLGGPTEVHAQLVADAVKKHPGQTVLVVGHSNTIMAYVAALGGPSRAVLCDHQYDGIYTLVIAHGETRMVEGRYGPANPPAAPNCPAMQPPRGRP